RAALQEEPVGLLGESASFPEEPASLIDGVDINELLNNEALALGWRPISAGRSAFQEELFNHFVFRHPLSIDFNNMGESLRFFMEMMRPILLDMVKPVLLVRSAAKIEAAFREWLQIESSEKIP